MALVAYFSGWIELAVRTGEPGIRMQALLDLEAHDLPTPFIQHCKRGPAYHLTHTLSADKNLLRREMARVLQDYRWRGRDIL